MELYTGQMNCGKWVPSQLGIPVLDVTVKSGDTTFAPDWETLMNYKRSPKTAIDEAEYTERFLQGLRDSFRSNPERWREILSMDSLCILCYCRKGKFCHRLILVDVFEKQCKHWNIPFVYKGELSK